MHVEVVRTDALGDRSYLVHDGAVGVVIDPQRDFDRIERLARDRGVRISHVAETHLHNDYVTGGPELARRHGAVYLVGETEGLDYEATRLESGDRVDVGALSLTAVATPGHTDNHLAYIVDHDGEQAVFSGGSLLYGSVGRPDLVDPERTTELAKAQYRSARRLVDSVPDDAVLYPTHGFGSFCASDTAATTESSTIGEQRRTNRALTDTDEDHFVERLLANLTDYPSYYAHMAPLNRAGLAAPRLELPEPVDLETLRKRLADGEWVVDLRDRVAFAAKHVEGTVSFEYGDGTRFTTFLGWTLPWLDPVTLVGSEEDVRAAIRDLSRIGIDDPDVALGDPTERFADELPMSSYPSVGWEELAAEFRRGAAPTVLDVRRIDEYENEHIDGAVNIPLHELLTRISELGDERIWVHCGSGYRASTVASLLDRAGYDVVHIDSDFADVVKAGIPLSRR